MIALLAALAAPATPAPAVEAPDAAAPARASGADAAARSWRIVTSTPLGPDLSSGLDNEATFRRGVASLAGGDPGAAAEAFESALAERPDRTPAHALLGLSLLSAGSHRAIGQFPVAVRAFLADFEAQSRLAFNLLLAAALGLAVLLLGGILAPVLRALPLAAHEIIESLPARLPRGVRGAYPLILLIAPIYLWRPWIWPAGLVWALLLYTALVRRHLGRPEKRLLAILGLFVVAAPSLLVLLGLLAAPSAPRSLAFALAHARDPLLREHAAREVESALSWKGDDPHLLFDLAILRREAGRVEEARGMYEKIVALDEDHAGARVNLGNIHLARGEREQAVEAYRRAVGARPGSAPAHYDLGQVLLEDFDFGEAKSHLRTASSLNFDFVQSLSRASLSGKSTLLVDEAPTAAERWRWLVANRKEMLQVTPREALLFATGWLQPREPAGCALLAALFLAALAAGRLSRRAEPCASCGTPVCRGCRVRLSRRDFCGACADVARREASVDELERMKRDLFRKAHAPHRAVALVLAVFVPGAGHVYVGRRAVGKAILFAAGAGAFLAATGGGLIAALPRFDADIIAATRPGLFLALLVLHVAGIVHFWTVSRRRLS
jgi:tetratricopeptide (TPR) repeat protein